MLSPDARALRGPCPVWSPWVELLGCLCSRSFASRVPVPALAPSPEGAGPHRRSLLVRPFHLCAETHGLLNKCLPVLCCRPLTGALECRGCLFCLRTGVLAPKLGSLSSCPAARPPPQALRMGPCVERHRAGGAIPCGMIARRTSPIPLTLEVMLSVE